jgi:predicted transcriptional regulator
MKSILDYLELVGSASGDAILRHVPEGDLDELWTLINDGEVSVHSSRMGQKFYRFPAQETAADRKKEEREVKTVRKKKVRLNPLLAYIKANPGSNGKAIRTGLGMSQAAFDPREAELLAAGKITRNKIGVAWKYYVAKEI